MMRTEQHSYDQQRSNKWQKQLFAVANVVATWDDMNHENSTNSKRYIILRLISSIHKVSAHMRTFSTKHPAPDVIRFSVNDPHPFSWCLLFCLSLQVGVSVITQLELAPNT